MPAAWADSAATTGVEEVYQCKISHRKRISSFSLPPEALIEQESFVSDGSGKHPYLAGNFAPIQTTLPLTPCSYEGTIPSEFAGAEYVRNGGNPLTNEDLGRDAHWFDGDGMLTGVLFRRAGNVDGDSKKVALEPNFVNQFLLTDVYCHAKSSPWLKRPVPPSISTLINPLIPALTVVFAVVRTLVIVVLSWLPGRNAIRQISVANTHIVYHDGRALATCESGPPLRVLLPGLETIGWFNGRKAENEPIEDSRGGFGSNNPVLPTKQWTTGHPKVDPITKELIAFHTVMIKPFIRYSVVKPTKPMGSKIASEDASMFDRPVPGVSSSKLIHDFGVSHNYTVIPDMPLHLNPLNCIKGIPNVFYDATGVTRFGVFPRHDPEKVQWFETKPCMIFHTANTWDTVRPATDTSPEQTTVHLVAPRLTSASMIFGAGNLPVPELQHQPAEDAEEDQCRLYYYKFPLATSPSQTPQIKYQWALSVLSIELVTVASNREMSDARFVYGGSCSASFTTALGRSAKIDFLVKVDVQQLIAQGEASPPNPVIGCVDTRSMDEILASENPNDPIKAFKLPPKHYISEPRFVPRADPQTEDDGWVLTYVFDESQLDDAGDCPPEAKSELWVIDAIGLKEVVAKIKLPQRVPYGLHGNWFSEDDIKNQRPFERIREVEEPLEAPAGLGMLCDSIERWLG